MKWSEELDKEVPEGWKAGKFADHANIKMGQSPKGDTYNDQGDGLLLVNGPVEFGTYFAKKTKRTILNQAALALTRS